MNRWILIAIVVGLLALGGGAVVLSGFKKDISDEVKRQLSELRPDLSDTMRDFVGNVLAAQASFESGFGLSKAYRQGFNAWNISKGSWQGPTITGGDTEYDDEGNVTKITQEWRKYDSLAAAVSDFFTLLSWSRYRPARDALFNGDEVGYLQALHAGGFYTLPVAEYVAGVESRLA